MRSNPSRIARPPDKAAFTIDEELHTVLPAESVPRLCSRSRLDMSLNK
jgi:hypothetical protein